MSKWATEAWGSLVPACGWCAARWEPVLLDGSWWASKRAHSPREDDPRCSVGLCAMQAGPELGGMGGRYVSSAQFSSVQFSSVQFSSVQFSSLQFRLGQVSSVQISHARVHACTGSRQPCAVECRMAARQRALLAAAAACCSRFARDGEPFRQALSRCRQRAAASAAAR